MHTSNLETGKFLSCSERAFQPRDGYEPWLHLDSNPFFFLTEKLQNPSSVAFEHLVPKILYT